MKKIEDVCNLYEYIELTKERTAMYLGEATLSSLYFNVCGYQTACYLKNIDENLTPDFNLFHDFVADYFLRGESTAGWRKIILAECFGDEEAALRVFYEIFDLFLQNQPAKSAKKKLYKLLEILTLNQEILDKLNQENAEEILNKLKELPSQLQNVSFSFQYDYILEDLKKVAENSLYLQGLLDEIESK